MIHPILRDRARVLAKQTASSGEEKSIEVLEFALAGEIYCVETSVVGAAHPVTDLTPVPGTPGHILGLTAIRGRILCVLDIRPLLGLTGTSSPPKVVLLQKGGVEFGLGADSITGTFRYPLDRILPPPAEGTGAEFLRGVIPGHGVLLDGAALLEDQNLIVHQGDVP